MTFPLQMPSMHNTWTVRNPLSGQPYIESTSFTDHFLSTRTPDESLGVPEDGHFQSVPRALGQILIIVPFLFGSLDHGRGCTLEQGPGDEEQV